jgi:hypothetical protein
MSMYRKPGAIARRIFFEIFSNWSRSVMVALSIREMTVRPTVWMSLMVLVVTGTPPKTANGAVAAIGVTGVHVVGSVAAA